ncbi:hypothetical protein [Desulfosporosinus sp. Sb-LF]|uniref:hypothetical protein n=1 Tax=Desulfosporosinus sp. Sb-LF TaxID=2560027 RepID=UPI0013052861|nr:hypothetical protein [Desulfosporosinus sp. Sb-LF]
MIKQTPLGEATSIRFNRFITAPGGINIRSIVPGNGPHWVVGLDVGFRLVQLVVLWRLI